MLGAGASCLALPTVNQIESELERIIGILNFNESDTNPEHYSENAIGQHYYIKNKGQFLKGAYNKSEILEEFIISLRWLKSECSKHFSIDTYAKKLFLQENFKKLNELKVTLSCFFAYLQNTQFDNRYDNFLASIIDNLYELPPHIKVLSWNYDYQLEIAMGNFLNTKKIIHAKKSLNVTSKKQLPTEENNNDKFCLFKINGTTSVEISKDKTAEIVDEFEKDKYLLLDRILLYYYSVIHETNNPSLSFAWENDGNEKFLPLLSKAVSNTEVLIVIGYSFPFFNRKIDKQILKSMTNLRKIYVQDPKNADSILQRIKSLLGLSVLGRNMKYETISNIKDQFYIPFEL